jgi:uncharacterized phage protein (TIGR02218 family)
MRTANAALITYLATNDEYLMADLYTFTLINGTILRYTDKDIDLSVGGNNYSSNGLFIKRSRISLSVGLNVDNLQIDAYPTTANIGGVDFLEACRNGALDGGFLKLERAFFNSWNDAPVGTITLFYGRVADVDLGRTAAQINIASILELLNAQWPINVYLASCVWSLYGNGCGLNKATFAANGVVSAGGNYSVFNTNLAAANNYYDQGIIIFTSGNDSGSRRVIKGFANANGQVTVIPPLPYTPETNANFTAYPGCDKTANTCLAKFVNVDANNNIKFRGWPYIPIPETGY